jgi:hypothetical protein
VEAIIIYMIIGLVVVAIVLIKGGAGFYVHILYGWDGNIFDPFFLKEHADNFAAKRKVREPKVKFYLSRPPNAKWPSRFHH